MIHKAVFEIYKAMFDDRFGRVEAWFPNGKNAIRIRMTSKREYIFTYVNPSKYGIETAELYLDRMPAKK